MTISTMEKPKRPCSVYNLFYQIEREFILQDIDPTRPSHILKEIADDVKKGKQINLSADNDERPLRYRNLTLPSNWFKSGKRVRKHRKTNTSVGFKELNTMISKQWEMADEKTKRYFKNIYDGEWALFRKSLKSYRDTQAAHALTLMQFQQQQQQEQEQQQQEQQQLQQLQQQQRQQLQQDRIQSMRSLRQMQSPLMMPMQNKDENHLMEGQVDGMTTPPCASPNLQPHFAKNESPDFFRHEMMNRNACARSNKWDRPMDSNLKMGNMGFCHSAQLNSRPNFSALKAPMRGLMNSPLGGPMNAPMKSSMHGSVGSMKLSMGGSMNQPMKMPNKLPMMNAMNSMNSMNPMSQKLHPNDIPLMHREFDRDLEREHQRLKALIHQKHQQHQHQMQRFEREQLAMPTSVTPSSPTSLTDVPNVEKCLEGRMDGRMECRMGGRMEGPLAMRSPFSVQQPRASPHFPPRNESPLQSSVHCNRCKRWDCMGHCDIRESHCMTGGMSHDSMHSRMSNMPMQSKMSLPLRQQLSPRMTSPSLASMSSNMTSRLPPADLPPHKLPMMNSTYDKRDFDRIYNLGLTHALNLMLHP